MNRKINIYIAVIGVAILILICCSGVVSPKVSKETDSMNAKRLEAAALYGYNHYFLDNYNFILYFNNSLLPVSVKINDNNSNGASVIESQIPLKDRKIDTGNMSNDEGKADFIYVIEKLSANRLAINFDKLYKQYGWIVRKLVSKTEYQERYSQTVDMLLLVYSDLNANNELYGVVEEVMQKHWEYSQKNPYIGLPDYCGYLKNSISEDMLARLEKLGSRESNTEYENDYTIIWSYSFWLRRLKEGKTDEFYNILRAISSDFS